MKNNNLQISAIKKSDLIKMAESKRNGGLALSFYLGLNQRINFRSEANSILSKETERIKKEKEYPASAKKKMLAMISLAKKEINFLRLPQKTNALVFFLRSNSKIMIYRVPVHIKSKIIIGFDFYIEPLVKIIEQFPRCLVVLMERDKAEFFSIFLGEFEGEPEVVKSDVPKKIRTSTSDDWHGRREQKIERHIDDHLNRHLKAVALKIRGSLAKNGFKHLIIGSHKEIKAKFQNLLDKKSAEKLLGFFNLPHYNRSLIKEKSMAIIRRHEKSLEEKIIDYE